MDLMLYNLNLVDSVKVFVVRDKFQLTLSRGHSFVTKCPLYWYLCFDPGICQKQF